MVRAFTFFFLIFLSTTSFAGAWVQEKGHWLNIATLRRYLSSQFWTSGGRILAEPTFSKWEIDNYSEYGVTDNFTLCTKFTALESHDHTQGTQGGIYQTGLIARYRLWKSDWSVLTVQLLADRMGRAAQFNIPPQNSKFNSGEALLFGTSGKFGKVEDQYWWFDILFGAVQRYRAGNQIQLEMGAGWKFNHEKFWLMLQNWNSFSADQPFYPQGVGYNLVTIVPSMMFWINKNFGFQGGVAQDVYGQNVGKGASVFIASWIQC